jgi:hypothetical protein
VRATRSSSSAGSSPRLRAMRASRSLRTRLVLRPLVSCG